MLSVDPVPGSKRDKFVSITDKGQRWRTIAAGQIRGMEDEIAGVLGEDRREVMRKCLVELLSKTTP